MEEKKKKITESRRFSSTFTYILFTCILYSGVFLHAEYLLYAAIVMNWRHDFALLLKVV